MKSSIQEHFHVKKTPENANFGLFPHSINQAFAENYLNLQKLAILESHIIFSSTDTIFMYSGSGIMKLHYV